MSMKTILKFLLPLLILSIGALGFRYLYKTKPQTKPIKTQEQSWIVTVMSAKPKTLTPTVTLYGRIESPRFATLRTPSLSLSANVEVMQVNVLEGQNIKKGQLLIRLEDKDSQFNLKQREADSEEITAQIQLEKQTYVNNLKAIIHEEALLSLTQTSVQRLHHLQKQKVSSQSALENAQRTVEQQKLAVLKRRLEIQNHQARLAQLHAKQSRALAMRDLARLEVTRTQVIAPLTGIIADVAIAVGDRVRSGDVLLSVYDNRALEVRAQIPSRYQGIVLDALADNKQLTASTQVNQKPVHLQLDRMAGQINPDSGGIDGLFLVKEGEHLLRLGQFFSLFLNLPEQMQVVAIPYEAIYGTNRIYKLVDERMQKLIVERVGEQIKPSGQSQILVRSPELQYGDQIIITQLPNAMDGLKVQVMVEKENNN